MTNADVERKQHLGALNDLHVPLTDIAEELNPGRTTTDTRERNARTKFVYALKEGNCEATLSHIIAFNIQHRRADDGAIYSFSLIIKGE